MLGDEYRCLAACTRSASQNAVSGSQPAFPGCDLSIMLRVAELNVWPEKRYRWAASLFTDADALVFPAAFGC